MAERDIRPISELEPWKSDPPPFAGSPSAGEYRDDQAIAAWPYPLPSVLIPELTPRHRLLLSPGDGPQREQPQSLTVWLCPADVSPETHGVRKMERLGVPDIHLRRTLEPPMTGPPPVQRGWGGPEYVWGGHLSKTRRQFVGVTSAYDGYSLTVTVFDNPRDRSRADILAVLDRLLAPFRDPRDGVQCLPDFTTFELVTGERWFERAWLAEWILRAVSATTRDADAARTLQGLRVTSGAVIKMAGLPAPLATEMARFVEQDLLGVAERDLPDVPERDQILLDLAAFRRKVMGRFDGT